MIKMVYFDFGGVLTESGTRGFIQRTIAELYNIPAEQVAIEDLHALLRRGKATDEFFFTELNKRFGGSITKEMFLAKADAGLKKSMEVYDLAASLRARGIRTGILSNVFAMNAHDLTQKGYYEGFDPIVLSCTEGHAKPEPELYLVAIKKSGVNAEEILFIDDQPKCIPPAEALGMHTVLAVSPAQIVADTKQVIAELNGVAL